MKIKEDKLAVMKYMINDTLDKVSNGASKLAIKENLKQIRRLSLEIEKAINQA